MEKVLNSYPFLNEKLAFINGYLNSIAILNSMADNGMEHWMIDLGSIDLFFVHVEPAGFIQLWDDVDSCIGSLFHKYPPYIYEDIFMSPGVLFIHPT